MDPTWTPPHRPHPTAAGPKPPPKAAVPTLDPPHLAVLSWQRGGGGWCWWAGLWHRSAQGQHRGCSDRRGPAEAAGRRAPAAGRAVRGGLPGGCWLTQAPGRHSLAAARSRRCGHVLAAACAAPGLGGLKGTAATSGWGWGARRGRRRARGSALLDAGGTRVSAAGHRSTLGWRVCGATGAGARGGGGWREVALR